MLKNTMADSPELQEMEKVLRAEAEAEDRGTDSIANTEAAASAKDGERAPAAGKDGQADDKTDQAAADADQAGKTAKDEQHAFSRETAFEKELAGGEKAAGKNGHDETKYSKAKKDGERLDRSWKALNEEKEAFRLEQERLRVERETREAVQMKAAEATPPPAARVEGILRYTPEELESAANEFDEEGNPEMAQRARLAAAAVRKHADRAKTMEHATRMKATQDRIWAEVAQANPDLKDERSPLSQEVIALSNKYPVLSSYPEGVRHAVEIAKLRATATKAVSLEKRVVELEAENKKLKDATSLHSAPPGGRTKDSAFEDMTLEQQEKYLADRAQEIGTEEMFDGKG